MKTIDIELLWATYSYSCLRREADICSISLENVYVTTAVYISYVLPKIASNLLHTKKIPENLPFIKGHGGVCYVDVSQDCDKNSRIQPED